MKILAIDSSGLVASVAVLEDETLVAEYTICHKKTHSQTLLPMLDEIRRMTELELASIDAIAIAAGPGSFTGLRIGSATAKGLGLALDKPIVSVPTTVGLAYNVYGASDFVCPLMDARREQVYTGVYSFVAKEHAYALETHLEECAISIDELTQKLNALDKRVVLLGDGVPVYRAQLEEKLTVPYVFAPACCNMQSGASVGQRGLELLREGKAESAMAHKPVYLRVSQAERERNAQILIRPMEEKDLAEVAKLEEDNFSMPWSVDAFREMVFCPEACYLVAEDKGKICATAGVRNISGEGEVTNVVVREEYRESGLGSRLMECLLDQGKALGAEAFTLEVRVSNTPAIRLYEKLGFISEGIRPKFYEKPIEDAMIMWKR